MYDRQSGKFLSIVAENLPELLSPRLMKRWTDNPEALQKLLMDLLVWKTINLGTGLEAEEDFCRALEANGQNITERAKKVLPSMCKMGRVGGQAELVLLSVSELGFSDSERLDKIRERALGCGLRLCSPEVGPQLRSQYLDQPFGESVIVLSEVILCPYDWKALFDLRHNSEGLELDATFGYNINKYFPNQRFVFMK